MNKIVPYFSTICNKKIFNIYNHIALYLFAYIRGTFFLNTFLPRRRYSCCCLRPLHRHLLRAYLARHLLRAPRHIGIFFAPFSPRHLFRASRPSASFPRLSRPDIFSAPLAPASSSRLSSPTSFPRPSPHRHLLRAFLAISAPRRGFSYYLPFLLQKKSGFCGFNT